MEKFGIGQPVRRKEDPRLVAGRGRFVEDVDLPHQCHGAVLYSPHAHALIRRIDVAAALASPGVLCVLTGGDVAAEKLGPLPTRLQPEALGPYPKAYRALRPILAIDRVRCVGDRVAFVVAETAAQARDAVELIEVDYETLPAVVNVEDAAREGASLVYEDCPGNVAAHLWYGDEKATQAAFARAAHVVSIRLEANRISANALENRGSLGEYNALDETFTLYHSSQNPHGARAMLAGDVFGIPETRMRVVTYDVGGGFGMKSAAYPEDALVLWASRRCGRPVKWIASRSEALLGDRLLRADADYVRERTGFAIGGVAPVAHATPPHVFLDEDLFAFDQVYAAAGTPFAIFAVSPADLERLTGGRRAALRKA